MAADKSLFNDSLKMRDSAQQKRKKARLNVNIPGEYRLEGQSEYYPCQLSDLGAGGLSLLSKGTLYSGDQLHIRFRMDQRSIEIRGVAVRVSGKSVGIQYQDVSEEEISAIQDFIHSSFFEKEKKKP